MSDELSVREKYARLQREFDAALDRSTKYDKLSQHWFILAWPYAFLRWYLSHRKARTIVKQMRGMVAKYADLRDLEPSKDANSL